MTSVGFVQGTWAILKKELRVFFLSPPAYAFLAVRLFLAGTFFYMGVALSGEASLRPMMANLGVALLFCLPMVTMRLLAGETRAGTLELLLTSPVPLGALILGKWMAAMTLCGVLLVATLPYPAILWVLGDPDGGVLFTNYVGLLACCSAFSAAGLFASSVTRDQMVAGVGGVVLVLPFWLVSAIRDVLPEASRAMADRVSFLAHLKSFARGVLDLGDIAWFAGFTGLFLFLSWRAIESRRWR